MKNPLLYFDKGLLLILKWEIKKAGIVNKKLMRGWSEKVTDSAEMDGSAKKV